MDIDAFMMIDKKRLKGSITVESAFVFTLTVFILFLMLGPLLIIKTTSDFIIELNQMSKTRCDYEMIKYKVRNTRVYDDIKSQVGEDSLLLEHFDKIEQVVGDIYLFLDFNDKYGDTESEYKNIDFVYDMSPSIYDEETDVVKYDYLVDFKLPYNVLHVHNVNNRLVSFRRAFVGADGNRFDGEFEEGDHVYVANNYVNSSVYHLNLNCTYLIKRTTSFNYKNLSHYRNYENKKYTKCDYCFRSIRLNDETVCYITQYGDRFHYRSNCPLMTAYVTKIPKTSIEGYNLRPCFKCAKGGK